VLTTFVIRVVETVRTSETSEVKIAAFRSMDLLSSSGTKGTHVLLARVDRVIPDFRSNWIQQNVSLLFYLKAKGDPSLETW
jgi:hypothetical protein